MPDNWKTYRLGDLGKVQTGPFGSQLHQKDYVIGGTPLVTVKNLGDRKINRNNLDGVSSKDVKRLSKYVLKCGDIVFSRVGVNIDRSSIVTDKEDGWLFSSSTLMLRLNQDKIYPDFLIYVLNTDQFKNYIRTVTVGATRPSLNTSILSNAKVVIPALQEQKSIASILSALDDKIELNLQMNKTLEEMAMALYKHWFVDFGPFQDGGFVDSELGEIPKGWEVKTLEDEFKITIGRTPPRKEKEWFSSENGIKWISIRDMGNCGTYIFNTSEYLTEEAVVKKNVPQVPANTVILSFKLTVGRVAITTENMVSNEAIAHFLKKKNTRLSSQYLYSALKSFDYNSLGSTSSIATAVNSKTVKSMKILVPSKSVLDNFQQEIFSFFELIKTNSKETQTFAQLRDTLLPKLISGEVRVKDAEKTLSEVL